MQINLLASIRHERKSLFEGRKTKETGKKKKTMTVVGIDLGYIGAEKCA
jgi:ribosomal protein S13